VNAIIPAVTPQVAGELTKKAVVTSGITTIKVKVGAPNQWLGDDIERVAAIRSVLEQNTSVGKIRIDANGAWQVDEAIAKLAALDAAANGLDYVEQPVRTLEELIALRSHSSVRVAIDENLRLDGEIANTKIRQAADLVIIKAIPFGGVNRALDFANEIDLPVVVSGSLDTYVGLSSGLALAGALPELGGACGLGTGVLFAQEIVANPPEITNGELRVERFVPDPSLLAEHTIPSQTRYWQERMIAAWNAGANNLVSPEVRKAVEEF
jgi:O-succinylbenzoate synthase